MKRRNIYDVKKKNLFTKRFYPAGVYTWTVPEGCTEVDVFIVGAGGSGSACGGGGGYTKTYKRDASGWRDGGAIAVSEGDQIQVIVGKGGERVYTTGNDVAGNHGGYSQFMNSNYRADGGAGGSLLYDGGSGGSGGASYPGNGGVDGGDAYSDTTGSGEQGKGQGHTTRDFGESTGKRNAGGGGGQNGNKQYNGGESDYEEGKGGDGERNGGYSGLGGGGYGGGGGAYRGWNVHSGAGGDGTVMIRYYAYNE